MSAYLTQLKAFLTSSVASTTRRREELLVHLAFLTLSTTSSIAPTLDRLGLKPCCLLESPPALSIAEAMRGFSILSRSFPAVFSIHKGRYADGLHESPFPLLMRTNLCHFPSIGNMPSVRQAKIEHLKKILGLLFCYDFHFFRRNPIWAGGLK